MTDAERREQDEILARLQRDGRLLAEHFGLPLQSVEPEPPRVRRRYGVCYADGRVRIRLRHARSGRPLKYSFLVDTLCHELAHLRHFNHGARFRAFYARILAHARRIGVYRPTPRLDVRLGEPASSRAAAIRSPRNAVAASMSPGRAPVQLELF